MNLLCMVGSCGVGVEGSISPVPSTCGSGVLHYYEM